MNESTNECEGKSKARDSVEQKECRVQRYDPKGMQIELVRKEHLALVIGGILPLLVAITNYVAFSGRITQNIWAAGVIVPGVFALLSYLFAMNVKEDLKQFRSDFDYKNVTAETAKLNELDQKRAWTLFFLLHKLGEVCVFFTSMMLSSCLIFLFKSFIN